MENKQTEQQGPISQQLQEWCENQLMYGQINNLYKLKQIIQQVKELEALNSNLQLQQIEILKENNRLRLIELKFNELKQIINTEKSINLEEFKKELQRTRLDKEFDGLFKICALADKHFGEKK